MIARTIIRFKHLVHVGDFRRGPVVEWTVVGVVAFKHLPHVCHPGHVPSVDVIGDRLLAVACTEHALHTCHAGHVPPVDVKVTKIPSENTVVSRISDICKHA